MSPNYSMEEQVVMREFQQFLDGAIHALRGPLRGINTSATLLSQKWNEHLDAEGRGLLRQILDGVSTLGNLTRALADYSIAMMPHSLSLVPLPVENAVRNAMAANTEKIQETGARISYGSLPRIAADHEQLSLLFRCLLRNAMEYRGVEPPQIEITATCAGDVWRFAVSDNGTGIAPEFQRQIFDPFERLHGNRSNFGLGLAVCKKIVSGHGGRLWVISKEGEGSTFFFTLPVSGA